MPKALRDLSAGEEAGLGPRRDNWHSLVRTRNQGGPVTAATIATAPAREPAAIRTTVGKKVLVALSGILFIGFVFAHMIGNLKIFLGPKAINTYGEWLRDMGEPAFPRSTLLWLLRS